MQEKTHDFSASDVKLIHYSCDERDREASYNKKQQIAV